VELDKDTVGILLAGVFAGLAVLLAVVALARQPFLLLTALPFAAAAYLVWMGATGRTPFVGGRRSVDPAEAREGRTRHGEDEPGGRSRFAAEARRNGAGRRAGRRRERRRAEAAADMLARREAARVLGVDADAEPAAVRNAYRDSVKEVHPDTEGGDREQFQKLTEAYERLRENET
jgi:hypothetical protein